MSEASPNLAPQISFATESALTPTPPRRRRKRLKISVAILFLLLGFAFAPLVYGAVRAAVVLRDMRTLAINIQNDLRAHRLSNVLSELEALRVESDDLQSVIKATGYWRVLPVTGGYLRDAEAVRLSSVTALDGVEETLRAFIEVEAAALATATDQAPDSERRYFTLTTDEKRIYLAQLAQRTPELRAAGVRVALALERWPLVGQAGVSRTWSAWLATGYGSLSTLQRGFAQSADLLDVLLPLSGYAAPKTYLVILQNADELRPTGGFIGMVGSVTLDAGEVRAFEFQNVYAVDGAVARNWQDEPPEILKRELKISAWYLRDSNWSPDFPTAAARILDVYMRERAAAGKSTPPLDGVIALQPGLFSELLQLTGPLNVDGETYDADNFFSKLEYEVEMGFREKGVALKARKDIVARAGAVMWQKLSALPLERYPELLDLLTRALERHDILLSVQDPMTQRLLDDRHWTGRTRAAEQDYLWVVDANLAAYKTDGVMDKQITYALDLTQPNSPVATLTLRYTNTNRNFTWRYTRYRDYVRVYVPEGSELLEASGAMALDKNQAGGRIVPGQTDVMRDLGKTVFGAFWAVEPGETRELRFRYRLPSSVFNDPAMYKLLVQKQPGANTRLTLDLAFGKTLLSATPPEATTEFGDRRYRASVPLQTDYTLEVKTGE